MADAEQKGSITTLRILCFGASITQGYYASGLYSHPYAIQLRQTLQQYFKSKVDVHVDIDAVPGDKLIGGRYFPRLQQRIAPSSSSSSSSSSSPSSSSLASRKASYFAAAAQNHTKLGVALSEYDIVIVQAGGNDLLAGHAPEKVFAELQRFWRLILSAYDNASHQRKGIILALTVTDTAGTSTNGKMRARYETFNRMIRSASTESTSGQERKRVWACDVQAALPYSSTPSQRATVTGTEKKEIGSENESLWPGELSGVKTAGTTSPTGKSPTQGHLHDSLSGIDSNELKIRTHNNRHDNPSSPKHSISDSNTHTLHANIQHQHTRVGMNNSVNDYSAQRAQPNTFGTSTSTTKEEMWDDGLHFTPHGYNLLGAVIARRIIDILDSSSASASASASDLDLNGDGIGKAKI